MPDPDASYRPPMQRPTRRRVFGWGVLALAAPGLAGALGGCGFRPVHAGPRGTTRDPLPAFDIPIIEEREGQLLRNALLDRLTFDPKAAYVLEVDLSVGVQGLGIQRDDEASLRRLNGVAKFVLWDRARPRGDQVDAEGRPGLLTGSVRLSALYNVFGERFPSQASQRGATRDLAEGLADGIHARLMGYFSRGRGVGVFPRL